MPAPGSIINGFGPGIFALLFGAINLNIQEISVTMRGACNDPVHFPEDLTIYPFAIPGQELNPEEPNHIINIGWAECFKCAGEVDFTYAGTTCTYDGYTLQSDQYIQGQSAFVEFSGEAPAYVYAYCFGQIAFSRTQFAELGETYKVAAIMLEPADHPGQALGQRSTDQANVHVTITNETCTGEPVEYPPFVNVTTPGELNLTIPCPVNLTDPFALHFDLPIHVSTDESQDAVINAADVVLSPGFPLFTLAIHNTSNATWTLIDPLLNEWMCTATAPPPPDMGMIERRRLSVPGEPGEPITASLFAYISPEFIHFLNQGPGWAYDECLASLQVVLNPLVEELPDLNRTADEHYTITYTLYFGPLNETQSTVTNTTELELIFLNCFRNELVPRVFDNAFCVPFGFGCLRHGFVYLNQLWRSNLRGVNDTLTALTFTCVDCLDQGLVPVLSGTPLHNVTFFEAGDSYAVCLATPTSAPILIERYINETTQSWVVVLRPLAIGQPAALPTVADYWACSHGVRIYYGATEPTSAGAHEILVTGYVGPLIHPFIFRTNITIVFGPQTCDACVTTVYPYQLAGFYDEWPLRTFDFAPAPYPLPSSQAPTPFIPAVPLVEWGVHLNPPCPICGFRIAFAANTPAVWAQDLLVCPTSLPSFIWCNYDSQQQTLTLKINPTAWQPNTPELLEWLLARVRYVNSAALHVQGERFFTLAFLQCGVPQPYGWYNNQTFASVNIVTRDIPGQPVCPILRTGATAADDPVSIGPYNVEPLVLLEGGGNSESAFIVGASVVITNCHPNEDVLDVDPSTLHSLPGLRWAWIPDGCKLTFEGGRPFADYARLLRAVRYSNSRGSQATEGVRVIEMFVWTPRCASRFWVSRLNVIADCNQRCTCAPRFNVSFTPSYGPLSDPFVELYHGNRFITASITETQAPLPRNHNSGLLYCQHPNPPGGPVVSARICIWRGYEYGVDSIYFQGQTEEMWAGFLAAPHVAFFEPPAVVAAGSGFDFETGCITLRPLAPVFSLPSSAFIEAINRLTFILGNTETLGHDRLIRVDFATDAGVGGGICTPPPVEVLLRVRNNETRLFSFGHEAVPLPPRPRQPPPANNTVLVFGVVTTEGVECTAVRSIIDYTLYTIVPTPNVTLVPGDIVLIEGRVAEVSICQQGITLIPSVVRVIGQIPVASFDLAATPAVAFSGANFAVPSVIEALSVPADGEGAAPPSWSPSSWPWTVMDD